MINDHHQLHHHHHEWNHSDKTILTRASSSWSPWSSYCVVFINLWVLLMQISNSQSGLVFSQSKIHFNFHTFVTVIWIINTAIIIIKVIIIINRICILLENIKTQERKKFAESTLERLHCRLFAFSTVQLIISKIIIVWSSCDKVGDKYVILQKQLQEDSLVFLLCAIHTPPNQRALAQWWGPWPVSWHDYLEFIIQSFKDNELC